MKNKYSMLMLLALVVSGCRSTNTSSTSQNNSINNLTSSSEVSSSSSNASTSSSSSIDKTGWIEENNENYAINNPKKWIYEVDSSKVNVTNAMYFEDDKMLYFDFYGNGNYNDTSLYYHDTYVFVGETYTTTFSITSNVAGKITVNGSEFDIKVGTSEIVVERELLEGNATVSIQFGAKGSSLISDNVCIEIGDLNISKITNVKARLEHAIELNNYTITLKEDNDSFNGSGYYGEFKFFEKAVHYSYGNIYDGDSSKTNFGYFENETGIFGFSLKNDSIEVNSSYYTDNNNEIIKGLYSTSEKIHNTDFTGDKKGRLCEGLPSLHKLDLSQFDYDLRIGESAALEDDDSLRYLSYMLGYDFCTLYYSGIVDGKVSLNSNDDLEISFTNAYKYNQVTFVISNIGATINEAIENFITSDSFYPSSDASEKEVDPALISMSQDIENGNYTVTKQDGTKFYMNDKYSYMETKDSETGTITVTGYIKTSTGLYAYSIDNNEVVVYEDENYLEYYPNITVAGLDGLNSGNAQYFKENTLADYTYNESESRYEFVPSASEYSYISFTNKWFNDMALSCDLITLKRVGSNIVIGLNVVDDDASGNAMEPTYKTLEVSNIGSTTVTVLDEYLASLEA